MNNETTMHSVHRQVPLHNSGAHELFWKSKFNTIGKNNNNNIDSRAVIIIIIKIVHEVQT